MATQNKSDKSNAVVENINKFLNPNNLKVMERFFKTIRDNNNTRYFDNTISKEENEKFDSLFPLVSAIIITANKIECDSLNYIFYNQPSSSIIKRKLSVKIFEDNNYCATDAYLIEFNSSFFLHLNACDTGSNTTGGSTDIVRYITNNKLLNPNFIVSFGICYGRNPNSQNIGDVIVPKKLYPWSIGQKTKETKAKKNNIEFKIKHDNYNINLEKEFSQSSLYNCANNFCNGNDGNTYNKEYRVTLPKQRSISTCKLSINVKMGNMSTGEAVVSSKDLKDAITKSTNIENELGGEMEGYGIAKECVYYAKIPCLIFKSICDWGEFKDIESKLSEEGINYPEQLKDKLQVFAAFSSGLLLIDFFVEYSSELLTIDFLKYMGKQNRSKKCDWYSFASKDIILKNIMNYFKVDFDRATIIFDQMHNKEVIISTVISDKYKTTYKCEDEN